MASEEALGARCRSMDMKRKERRARFMNVDVYPVISSEFTNGRESFDVFQSVVEGGVGIVQIREKSMSKRGLYDLCAKCRERAPDVLLIINDHLDVAMATEADGVHLGQDDLPIAVARRLAPELLIGASTHNAEEAVAAQEMDADYVNLGPLFYTSTKTTGVEPLGLEIVKEAPSFLSIPFTVMGGIKARHIPELVAIGARRIAMVTEITLAEDVRGRVQRIRQLINRGE